MRRFVLAAVAALALFVLAGCSYSVKLNPNIDPTANIANKVPQRVGLFMPEEVKSFTIEDNSDWAHKYTFNIGEATSSIVSKSMSRVFATVENLEAYPTQQMIAERKIDLVAVPKITSAAVSLNQKSGFFQDSATGNTQVSVQITFYSPDMTQLTAIQGSGMGVASKGMGAFTTGKGEYSSSVEDALRNLGDDLVHQTYGNYDIRKSTEAGQSK